MAGLLVPGLLALSGSSVADPEKSPITQYRETISPILEEHCYECHGDGYDKGKVAFDHLETDAQILDTDLWLRVLNNTRAGLMPAEQKPRLSAAQQQTLERWIKQSVFRINPGNPDPGRVTVRRLNRVEYRNTVRDLLGVDFNTEVEFPPDDTGYGFDTIGDALSLSPMLLEKYLAAAQVIVAEAVPTVARKPAIRTLTGNAFEPAKPAAKDGKLRLLFSKPANVTAPLKLEMPGTYRVVLELGIRGKFEFDPGRAHVLVKVDDQQLLSQDMSYVNEKTFKFESTHEWKPGERRFSVQLTPLPPDTTTKVPEDTRADGIEFSINKVIVEGPLEKDRWVRTDKHERYFPKPIPARRGAKRAYAAEILGAFAEKAFRRPLDDDTAERLAALAEQVYVQPGKSFEQGVAHAMTAVLASPRFLFRLEEPVTDSSSSLTASIAPVDGYALASRLSYFLWSTMPDAELMGLAKRGALRANLQAQVTRMLADPRAANLAQHFPGQWLQVRDVEGISSNVIVILARDDGEEQDLEKLRNAFMNQDRETIEKLRGKFFPPRLELNGELRTAMRRETEMFFAHIVNENRPVTELIDSDYTFVNEKLAKLYGLPGVTGADMRKVTLPPDSPRGGVLTHASALVATSNPDRTSPVKRGLFVLANFLGTPPPPPPANVPALEASENDIKGHEPTLRESLQLHRESPACRSCHNRMDPIGLAFENFNAVGMWRDMERKQKIQASGQLITGEEFNSVSELKRILVNDHRGEFYRTLAAKLLTYAVGRGPEYYDVETIDQIVKRLEDNEGRFSALLMGVIESAPFQKMRTQATVTADNS